jgi:hypothetical protein
MARRQIAQFTREMLPIRSSQYLDMAMLGEAEAEQEKPHEMGLGMQIERRAERECDRATRRKRRA